MKRRVVIAASLGLAAAASRAGPAPLDPDAIARARRALDRPLRFLLDTPGWRPAHFSHRSDLFSTWGLLVLDHAGAGGRATLMAGARASGFRAGEVPPGDEAPDLAAWGLPAAARETTLHRALGGRPPVRCLLRLWFGPQERRAVVRFRTDGE